LTATYAKTLRSVRVDGGLVGYEFGRLFFMIAPPSRVGIVQLSTPELGPLAAIEFHRVNGARTRC